jgi:APA family basic amino acid/polyamine antiporter
LVPILGILICLAMIISLPLSTQLSALAWLVIGLVIYFSYGSKNSRLGSAAESLPSAADFEKLK